MGTVTLCHDEEADCLDFLILFYSFSMKKNMKNRLVIFIKIMVKHNKSALEYADVKITNNYTRHERFLLTSKNAF